MAEMDVELLKSAAAGDPQNPIVAQARQELIRMGIEPPRAQAPRMTRQEAFTQPLWRVIPRMLEQGQRDQVIGNPRAPRATPVSSGAPVSALRETPPEFFEGMGAAPADMPTTDEPPGDVGPIYAGPPGALPLPDEMPEIPVEESVAGAADVPPEMQGVLANVLARRPAPGGSLGATIPPPPRMQMPAAAPSTPAQAGAAAADAATPSEMDTMLDGYIRSLMADTGEKDRALAIALMGANIAAGTSPNALTNIGAGVAKGLPAIADAGRRADERKGRALQLGVQREDRRERARDRDEDRGLRREEMQARREERELTRQYQQGQLSLAQYRANLERLRLENEVNRGDWRSTTFVDKETGEPLVLDNRTGEYKRVPGASISYRPSATSGNPASRYLQDGEGFAVDPATLERVLGPDGQPMKLSRIGTAAKPSGLLGTLQQMMPDNPPADIIAKYNELRSLTPDRRRVAALNIGSRLGYTPDKQRQFADEIEAELGARVAQPAQPSAPAATASGGAPQRSSLPVGQTATNPNTGEKVRWNGSAWEPVTK